MNNYKLLIQYDGSNYAGWQFQKNALSIQQILTETIKLVVKEDINIIGSGRTDAGVHALGQVANFCVNQRLDTYRILHSINSILPRDISVLSMEKVEESFHSRFDARKRSYIYLFSKFKSPFYYRYSYQYHHNTDCDSLNNLTKSLIGEHDFTSFSRKNSDTENKQCIVYDAHWKETKGMVIFYIEANRFLHGMVRTIVGTLLKAQKESYNGNYLLDIIAARNREKAGEAVPAKGLFIYKVRY